MLSAERRFSARQASVTARGSRKAVIPPVPYFASSAGAGRLGGFIAPLLIGYVASIGGFTAGLATTVLAFVAAMIVVWMAPETKGVKLQ